MFIVSKELPRIWLSYYNCQNHFMYHLFKCTHMQRPCIIDYQFEKRRVSQLTVKIVADSQLSINSIHTLLFA